MCIWGTGCHTFQLCEFLFDSISLSLEGVHVGGQGLLLCIQLRGRRKNKSKTTIKHDATSATEASHKTDLPSCTHTYYMLTCLLATM